jgi:hypothetical protein
MAQKRSLMAVDDPKRPQADEGEHELDKIRLAVRAIRYGEVRIVIQDGVIVQIDRVEKERLR